MNERIERLQTEAAKLGVATSGRRDGLYQALGAAAAVGGVVAGLVTYLASLRMDDSRNVLSAIILAVAMLAVSVIGTGVYLRYSLARFLRFWLLRQLYEGQDHVDRVVAAV
ncbi:MAG TPA: hypothetical protein VFI47_25725, partial [Acidimicrobiales bacterium]|nr:hypothetical protein [Acidimicrobiales bacterium]